MSSQPNEKAPEVPDALVKEPLRREGLPHDARVKVNVVTRRVRVNRDGTKTILPDSNAGPVRRGLASLRPKRPSKLVAIVLSLLGILQMAVAISEGHSDGLAAALMQQSESCQIARVASAGVGTTSPLPDGPAPSACRIEPATIVDRYAGSSRYSTTYHLVTVRPDGTRDDTPIAARSGTQLWKRVHPTELISLQRFVVPGYHLSGKVLALADGAGIAMSRSHPDSGGLPNAAFALMGGILFAVGMAMFVSARRAEGA
jgi:hypothetical protein